MFGQLVISGLLTGSIYSLVALGMTVLFRATTIVNFCHGEFFMVGAFAVYVTHQGAGWSYPAESVLTRKMAVPMNFSSGFQIPAGIPPLPWSFSGKRRRSSPVSKTPA